MIHVQNKVSKLGPMLVGLAAFLWATDALVRYPAIHKTDPTFIVFIEHLLAVLLLFPWMIMKYRKELLALNLKEWMSAIFCGVGGSALATILFSASFYYVNPSVAVLLQKLQPALVVVIAYPILGENPSRKFYLWGIIALAAAIVLSFPDLDFTFITRGVDLHFKGIQYAFGAAFLWAASTVIGKVLLKSTPAPLATFWRFFFGFLGVTFLLLMSNSLPSWGQFTSEGTFLPIIYLAVVPGILAMLIYYVGLSKTPANVTTFIELLYPIGAVALNTLFLHTPLGTVQTAAGGVLILSIAMISVE